MSNWNHVSSKLGSIEPATRSIAREVYDAARAAGHDIWFMWGAGSSGEHSTGRALDFMVRNKAAGDFINAYVWRHRVRLRLQHVIWWQRITSTTTQPGIARLMPDRGDSTQNHKDHPHVFLRPGAYRPPTGATTPQKEFLMTLSDREQQLLSDRVERLAQSVQYGEEGENPDGKLTLVIKRLERKLDALERKLDALTKR